MNRKPVNSIDDVIEILDSIIQESIKDEDTLGYFAALYQRVTIEVKEGIKANRFDDGPRMEKLDVIFAKRYIDAYYDWHKGRPVSLSWEKAFQQAENKQLLVIQHLLLGMNAHINLDLGVAAVEVSDAGSIGSLENDFKQINEILSSLVNEVQENLSSIWPFLRKILSLSGKVDNYVVDFSMKVARDGAWKFATELVKYKQSDRPEQLSIRDQKVARIEQIVTRPGKWIQFIIWIIRLTEKGTVAEKTEKLTR
ncbi:hypothetical protein D1614_18630 [Maribellus luteus]|uniref:Uncharacterized protein n=1 Tax=Maribellus luteus TaxID=2305463 RepID=A0A399SW18_9BACT|nr:DUF5995 family protein [Maribellus luteus]RIJ46431.1 hypothetical protein D1614_18630 [Maribellus luteus]